MGLRRRTPSGHLGLFGKMDLIGGRDQERLNMLRKDSFGSVGCQIVSISQFIPVNKTAQALRTVAHDLWVVLPVRQIIKTTGIGIYAKESFDVSADKAQVY